jgi:hydrogenase/urease accessory protein HupE
MIRWLIALFLVTLAGPVSADELRPGYVEFTQETTQEWRLVWKAPIKSSVTAYTQPILPRSCIIMGTPDRVLANMAVVTTARVNCTGKVEGSQIGLSAFGASQTDVLVRVAPLGRPAQTLRLTAGRPVAKIAIKPSQWQVASTYLATGVEHILSGYDHLLFVVALVLLLDGIWTIAKAVTAFTIAHSITLIGTTLGLLGLPQQPVEALIALSIIFLAVEILKKQPSAPRLSERIPWFVAFLFGLLHGFGFAGALQEIGLPETDVPTALLTFNLGVEAGQLVIVFITAVALAGIRRWAVPFHARILKLAAYAIGIAASFWFIERTLA